MKNADEPGPRPPATGNLFANLPDQLNAEQVKTLLKTCGVEIERIVSSGQSTPEGEWYDQAWDEWVVVLSGSAELLLAGETVSRPLRPGDYIMLRAHCRHRVTWTDPDQPTVWLALHIGRPAG